jgi:hypothetical protein
MAMLCSVTVSMGEETKGVLRVMRFVIGVSRVTSAAGKPGDCVRMHVASHAPCESLARTRIRVRPGAGLALAAMTHRCSQEA